MKLFSPIILALVLFSSCETDDRLSLERKMEVGDKWKTKISMLETTTATDILGGIDSIRVYEASFIWENKVQEKEGNEFRISGSYSKVKMNDYDSEDRGTHNSPYASVVGHMVGIPAQFWMNNKGLISKVKGGNGLFSTIAIGVNDQEILREMLEYSSDLYPKDKINIGDSWYRTFETSWGYPQLNHDTFTLLEVIGNDAIIAWKGEIVERENSPASNFGGMQVAHHVNGYHEGRIIMDLKNGSLKSLESNQVMEGTVDMVFLNPQAYKMSGYDPKGVEFPKSYSGLDFSTRVNYLYEFE